MEAYLLPLLDIIAGIVMLIVSSFILTFSIEDIGKMGKFSDSFTGSVISPIFTALPELVIIITALAIIGFQSGSEIAAGTIIGEPFMVSAIGFPMMGIILFIARRKGKKEDLDEVLPKVFIFIGLVLPIMLVPWFFKILLVKILVAILLVFLYVIFLRFVRGGRTEEEATNIEISGRGRLIAVLIVGVGLLLAGATILVRSIDSLASNLDVNRELITILIVPIGTIVPETMNSLIWASRGKTNLAVGALTGEEIYYATFFPALGMLASSWIITSDGILAVALTSFFSILIGVLSYRFRASSCVYLLFFASLVIFFFFIY